MSAPVQEPITGRESDDPATPLGALAEFYRAFNGRDLALMAANWCADDEPVMDNPLGGIRRGWADIRPTYETLFGLNGTRVTVEFHDYTLHALGDAFVAIGRERGAIDGPDGQLEVAIRTTRLFVRRGERFRQLHHHGSIEDPDMLSRYQAAFAGPGGDGGRTAG